MGKLFEKGNAEYKKIVGKPKAKTVVKKALGLDNIEQLKIDCLKVWQDAIRSKSIKRREFAAKEISKYLFAQKKQIDGNVNVSAKQQIDFSKFNDDELKLLIEKTDE
jgi:hypothetical protein